MDEWSVISYFQNPPISFYSAFTIAKNVCSPRVLLTSVALSVVKGIRCPETDEDHHLNKMMDLGHSASS